MEISKHINLHKWESVSKHWFVASLNANAFAMRIHLGNFRGGIEQNSQPTLIESEQH